MGFVFLIARKHLMKRCHSGFISFSFSISILGVAVGVMALIVVLSVMSGFDQELKAKMVGVQPHVIVEQVGGIQNSAHVKDDLQKLNLPGVLTIAPFVQGQAIVRSETYATGVVVKGIDLTSENLGFYQNRMKLGALDFTDASLTDENWLGKEQVKSTGRAMIGEELARLLNVSVGDMVSIISPAMDRKSISEALKKPTAVPFLVSGIFHLGMSDFDSGLVLINLNQGQKLYRLGDRVSGVSLRIADVEQADALKKTVRDHLDATFVVRSWIDLNRNFFSALKVEKAVMAILLSLIILVAAFNIVSSLTMVVMEKTKDIGILRALGATAGKISQIFLLEGFMIGIVGVVLGAVLGLLLAFNLNPVSDFIERWTGFSVFPNDIYFFDQIPVSVNFQDVWVIVMAALLMSLVAGFYPAYQAARLRPVEALRYE
ncbi:MAG: lipoprotein-releasing ABC transporter permease subunit [Candidatus Omnitrophica bacterium]|nr:lipoprotein-releasing ABC transporter permease subunit [Candidatus Omnitrophota bacterium]